jgi:hypothetical protein
MTMVGTDLDDPVSIGSSKALSSLTIAKQSSTWTTLRSRSSHTSVARLGLVVQLLRRVQQAIFVFCDEKARVRFGERDRNDPAPRT